MNINELGKLLVSCNLNCEGANNNPRRGVIPRCLILERRQGKKKCIVVGLNPGKCKRGEKEYYLKYSQTYDSVKSYFFESNLKNLAYFKRIRDLISILRYKGDILWTDLAKCECFEKNGSLPIQTLRVCINRFLRKEVKLFKAPTIFALGNVAFNFCALSFPSHFIIGLAHPTGAYGNFIRLKKSITKNPKHYVKNLAHQKDRHGHYMAIHITKI